jgi:polyhydroxyalkanoate synthase
VTATTNRDAIAAFADLHRKLLEGMLIPLSDNDGLEVAEIFRSVAEGAVRDSSQWLEIHNRYYRKQLELWKSIADRTAGRGAAPVVVPEPGDRRFRASEWREPYFDFLVQSYLLRAHWLQEIAHSVRLEPHPKKKLVFFVRQMIDSMSPANFPWSNPEALKLAFDTSGDSLAQGLKHLASDLDKGLVSMSDESAFELGRNLAVTPGAVVFENDYFQLIQYRPVTATVYERPLLLVPPCINKYYILDLQPENSFVRFAVEQGHTVFMVSWRNMPAAMGHASWDDYLEHGVLKAMAVTAEIGGTGKINALGFCVGGTLLGSALAVARARGDDPVASLTLLASLLDFSDTGELSVFVDEAYVKRREQGFASGGVLHGRELALTFASLRANDLIWRYVVNNYLKGRTPEPFDLLFWNADSTNLPGAMYVYYIRNMYLENNLRVPGKLTMCGAAVDLGSIDAPAYVLATREDHIVPWKTAYASTRLLAGKMKFVLAASGHVAGIVNPASTNRRSYWLNDNSVDDPEGWLSAAVPHPGSWWTHWSAWLKTYGGAKVPARNKPGGDHYNEIEPAPGRYVKEKWRSSACAAAGAVK